MSVNVRETERLLEAVRAAVPAVTGVAVGTLGVSASVAVEPADQQAAAQATINAFDWSESARNLWLAARTGNPVLRHAVVRLAASEVNSTNVLADVPGLSFQLKPNSHYSFTFIGGYTAAAGTTGLSLSVNGPASPSVLGVVGCIATSAIATTQGVGVAYNTPLTGSASGGATRLPFWVDGNISTGAAGGTFVLRFASEVNGSAVTILAGSMGELKEVGA